MRVSSLFLGVSLAVAASAAPYAEAQSDASKRGTLTHLTTTTVQSSYTSTLSPTPAFKYTGTTTVTSTFTSHTFRFNSTTTDSLTVTSTKTIPAPKTHTVPTPAGFTPIKSESFYTDVIVTSTATYTEINPVFTYPPPTTTITTLSTKYVIIDVTSTSFGVDTVTKTITASTTTAPATQTVYAQCAQDNIESKTPEGNKITDFEIASGIGMTVYASSAMDCCSLCAARADCVGGAFTIGSGAQLGGKGCQLGILASFDPNPTCNGSIPHDTFTGFNNHPGSLAVFNGQCGQAVPSPV